MKELDHAAKAAHYGRDDLVLGEQQMIGPDNVDGRRGADLKSAES